MPCVAGHCEAIRPVLGGRSGVSDGDTSAGGQPSSVWWELCSTIRYWRVVAVFALSASMADGPQAW